MILGFDLRALIEFLQVLDAVIDIEADKTTNTVHQDLKTNHASLVHHSLHMLINCMTPVRELSLIQQSELITVIDQMAYTIATHLVGMNPSGAFWMQILRS